MPNIEQLQFELDVLEQRLNRLLVANEHHEKKYQIDGLEQEIRKIKQLIEYAERNDD